MHRQQKKDLWTVQRKENPQQDQIRLALEDDEVANITSFR